MNALIGQVFTEEEERERFRFQQFCTTFFNIKAKNSKHFDKGIYVSTLFRWYSDYYPNNTMTEATVKHTLYFGGYLQSNTDSLWLEIREEHFELLTPIVQEGIINLVIKPKRLKLQNIMFAQQVGVHQKELLDLGLETFYTRMVFQKKYSYIYPKLSKDKRTISVKLLYDYYVKYCHTAGYAPKTKRELNTFLDGHKHLRGKGYFQKVSGILIYKDIFIPQNTTDLKDSFAMGLAVITLGANTHFNDNKIKNLMSPVQLAEYTERRLDKRYEQKEGKKETQQKKEEIWDELGDDIIVREEDVCARKETQKSQAHDADNSGIIHPDAGDCINDDESFVAEHVHARTSGVDTGDSEINGALCGRSELIRDDAVRGSLTGDSQAERDVEDILIEEDNLSSLRAAKKVLGPIFNEEFIQESLIEMGSTMTVEEVLKALGTK